MQNTSVYLKKLLILRLRATDQIYKKQITKLKKKKDGIMSKFFLPPRSDINLVTTPLAPLTRPLLTSKFFVSITYKIKCCKFFLSY